MVRFKNRWLLLSISTLSSEGGSPCITSTGPSNVSQSSIARALRQSVTTHFGNVAFGAIDSSLSCKYYSPLTGIAIVRCSRVAVRVVWASATMITAIEGRRIRMVVLHCGGTIRKVQKRAIALDREYILRLKRLQQKQTKQEQKHSLALASLDTGDELHGPAQSDNTIHHRSSAQRRNRNRKKKGDGQPVELEPETKKALIDSEKTIGALRP